MPDRFIQKQRRTPKDSYRSGFFFISIMVCMAAVQLYAEGKMKLSSPVFMQGGEIPSTYTCEDEDIAPPLLWEGVNENAHSLVLIVDDPDAPDPRAPKMTYVHWVLYNLPPETTGLRAGTTSADLPAGTEEGLNDWKRTGYGGPCPPIGRHRYFFKLYALDTALSLKANPTKAEVESAMRGHIIEQYELIGTYEKSRGF